MLQHAHPHHTQGNMHTTHWRRVHGKQAARENSWTHTWQRGRTTLCLQREGTCARAEGERAACPLLLIGADALEAALDAAQWGVSHAQWGSQAHGVPRERCGPRPPAPRLHPPSPSTHCAYRHVCMESSSTKPKAPMKHMAAHTHRQRGRYGGQGVHQRGEQGPGHCVCVCVGGGEGGVGGFEPRCWKRLALHAPIRPVLVVAPAHLLRRGEKANHRRSPAEYRQQHTPTPPPEHGALWQARNVTAYPSL
jgi:hypothetical protein